MADVKKTQKEMFAEIITLAEQCDRNDIVEFAQGRIEMLNRKSSSKKQTATQKTNEDIKERLVEVLYNSDKPMTVTELIETKQFDDFGIRITNQKVSALLSQLVKAEKVTKTIEKRVSYFSI